MSVIQIDLKRFQIIIFMRCLRVYCVNIRVFFTILIRIYSILKIQHCEIYSRYIPCMSFVVLVTDDDVAIRVHRDWLIGWCNQYFYSYKCHTWKIALCWWNVYQRFLRKMFLFFFLSWLTKETRPSAASSESIKGLQLLIFSSASRWLELLIWSDWHIWDCFMLSGVSLWWFIGALGFHCIW